MPSLSSLIASQLGLGSLPLAAPKLAVPGMVEIKKEKVREEVAREELKQRLFNTKPELLTSSGRRAMRAEKAKESAVPLTSPPTSSLPSEEISSQKPEAMALAPIWEAGMDMVKKIRASGDLALVSQLNPNLQAIESGNPAVAIPAAMALQQWYKNSPFAVADMTKGTVAKTPTKKKKEISDEP